MRYELSKLKNLLNIHSLIFPRVIFTVCLWFILLPAQPEQFNHPELEWKSIETEHFIVHYHQGTVRTANLVAHIAEEIYPHITGLYQQWPDRKTEFIIRDTDDYSNGGAYFFENKIEIWAQSMDYILRGTHHWLRDVVTHEFTHIVSMQKAFKFGHNVPAGWIQIFGYESERRPDVVRGFPNVLVSYPISGVVIPTWVAEGASQFQSPSRRFDYRDSHREMILRDRVLNHRLLDLNEMGVFGKNSIGNESAYNQGFSFVNFLTRTFGDSVIRDLFQQASDVQVINFNQAMKKVTGISADSSYQLWKNYLTETYQQRTSLIRQHVQEGTSLVDEGIGNIHPAFSPDGKKIAFVQSISDYLSVNALTILDIETGQKEVLTGPIASSVSWSPDGRYLTFSRQIDLQANGSSYWDIYVYDVKRNKSLRLTRGLRAINPDWSHDGQKLVFVVHADGLTNLFSLTLDEFIWIKKKNLWHTYYYDFERHELVTEVPPERKKDWPLYYRRVEIWGQSISQLTHFTDGRQIYHPRWSPDDSYIVFDTSTDFCRDIAKIPAAGGEFEFILNAPYDERYPSFRPERNEIFYASDETGIFNIYSYNLENGQKKVYTNVLGGAFMPTLNKRGDLAFALYKNQGYKMHWIQNVSEIPINDLVYDENYEAKIPVLNNRDSTYHPLPAQPYQRRFGPLGIMPRLFIDYGTVKPGLYFYSNEILNKMSLMGGFDINWDREYNLFILSEFNLLKPTIFLEFYNQSARVEDKFSDPDSFYTSQDKIKVNFNLIEADLGLRGKYKDHFQWEISYIFSLYRANIDPYSFIELASQQLYFSPEFRYTYLRGHVLSLRLRREKIFPYLDREVNPRKGYTLAFRYTREWNRFLDDFSTQGGDIKEIYSKYYFNRFYLDVEQYLAVPFTRYHSVAVRFQGGYIDETVDDFFHFFAGGFVGLKGFSYYSISGQKMAIGTVAYRFPLAREINFQLFNWYLDKIYLGSFYQFGNAWNSQKVEWDDFKSDIGVQVRFESYSWYMFPTRIFFEASYPFQRINFQDIRYDRQWKFYFGILFDFDIRLDQTFRRFK